MFNTPVQMIGAVLTVLVTVLVLWRGDLPARLATLASLAAFFLSPAVQVFGGLAKPLWGVAAVDAALLAFITALLWRFDRRWLIGAWACEALTVLCHAAKLADVTLLARGYVASLYVLYFGFLAALAMGAFEREPRRLSVGHVGP